MSILSICNIFFLCSGQTVSCSGPSVLCSGPSVFIAAGNMPDWCAVQITFQCSTIHDAQSSMETWDDKLGDFGYNFNDTFFLRSENEVKAIDTCTFQIKGYERRDHHKNEFMQTFPEFECQSIKVQYAEQGVGFFGLTIYSKNESGDWEHEDNYFYFYPMFNGYMLENHIYPNMISHAYAEQDSIDFAICDIVHAIETSELGKVLAQGEFFVTMTIASMLFAKVDFPEMIADHRQIINFINNVGALNQNEYTESFSEATWNHFVKEFFKFYQFDDIMYELFMSSG